MGLGFEHDYWVSGTKHGSNGFYWMGHDQEFAFTNWHLGEPNNAFQGESCVEIKSIWQYEWNDLNCNLQLRFICEE